MQIVFIAVNSPKQTKFRFGLLVPGHDDKRVFNWSSTIYDETQCTVYGARLYMHEDRSI